MPISKEEVVALVNAFHDVSMNGGTAAAQAKFFLHPEPRIFILHGEDWIVQRIPSGELKIALYINSYHRFLPDSAPIALN